MTQILPFISELQSCESAIREALLEAGLNGPQHSKALMLLATKIYCEECFHAVTHNEPDLANALQHFTDFDLDKQATVVTCLINSRAETMLKSLTLFMRHTILHQGQAFANLTRRTER